MLQNIKHRIKDTEIQAILADCIWQPTAERLQQVAERYLNNSCYQLLGYEVDGVVAGCAGIDISIPERTVLLHFAVSPAYRNRGIGKEIINEIRTQFNTVLLEAETDDDAVGFYRNCGFEIIELGEKYPGTQRYLCNLR